jgi:O-acetylhomoserine (thiol)-lyase
MDKDWGITTRLLHSDRRLGVEHGALHKPVHTSVAYGYADARDLAAVFQGSKSGFTYARSGNPTVAALEAKITALEEGVGTVCFASGMAAIGHTLGALLKAGDHMLASRHLFGNTSSLLVTLARLGIQIDFADTTEAERVRPLLRPGTRLLFVETIANPRTQVADLVGLGELCREQGILYLVDNTMSTPVLFKPRSVGAVLVMNSLTKNIGGHGNALGGAITDTGLFDWSRFDNIHEVYRRAPPATWGLTQIRKKGLRDMGGALSADAAHRISTGAETLALRLERCCGNAMALAGFLAGHPAVASVDYPGLASHPQHERARMLFGGRYGPLLSFELGDGINCFDFLNRLQLVISATHLGDNRTLGLPVAHTIYFEMGAVQRAEQGIGESLIRLSVGIEDEVDLIDDLRQALAASAGS